MCVSVTVCMCVTHRVKTGLYFCSFLYRLLVHPSQQGNKKTRRERGVKVQKLVREDSSRHVKMSFGDFVPVSWFNL